MRVKSLALVFVLALLSTFASAANQTAQTTITVTVVSQLTIATTALPAAVVGQPYSGQITATGGTTPYTFAASNLPQGLSISATTGAITGTVPATACPGPNPCPVNASFTVTDSSGQFGVAHVVKKTK